MKAPVALDTSAGSVPRMDLSASHLPRSPDVSAGHVPRSRSPAGLSPAAFAPPARHQGARPAPRMAAPRPLTSVSESSAGPPPSIGTPQSVFRPPRGAAMEESPFGTDERAIERARAELNHTAPLPLREDRVGSTGGTTGPVSSHGGTPTLAPSEPEEKPFEEHARTMEVPMSLAARSVHPGFAEGSTSPSAV